jgi:elongation factor 1-alpha
MYNIKSNKMSENEGKQHLGLVVVGHVDAGKSTTTGHLIFQLGGLKDRELAKLKEEAEALGKGSFAFAFFTDRCKEERERGVTIQCTTKEFFTETKHFSLIDAPGHRDFVKNMISGTAQADVALLMVPAHGFEVAIARGDRKTGKIEGQTRQHAMLTNLLGIEQLIVGINKMDSEHVNWSESRFNEIRDEVVRMLSQVGWAKKIDEIPVIPLSGLQGDNLTHVSTHMPWYKGFEVTIDGKKVVGHTLIDALEKVARVPPRRPDAPLRMPVSGVHNIKGVGDVITGRIEQGTLQKEAKVAFAPVGITGCKVFSIEMHHRRVDQASHGDNVGVNVKGLKKEKLPKVGDIMVLDDGNLPTSAKQFTALVAVQEHPGQLKVGYTPIVFVRTAHSACKMTKINWKIGKSTNKQKVDNPPHLEQGDQAEVVFEPCQDIYIDKFSECPGLGRVAIMEGNSLVMLGKVTDVVKNEAENK